MLFKRFCPTASIANLNPKGNGKEKGEGKGEGKRKG